MKAPALLTGADWHGYLVQLAAEAFDAAVPAPTMSPVAQRLRAQRRAVFLAHARERLAQAAQAVVLEIDLARGGER